MSVASSQSSAARFVFLKNKAKPNSAPKRMLIPTTMATLKKNATKLLGFPESKPVKSFYDEQGDLIEKISEIDTNTTLLASNIETEDFVNDFVAVRNNVNNNQPAYGAAPPSPSAGGSVANSRPPSQLLISPLNPNRLITNSRSRSPSALMVITDDQASISRYVNNLDGNANGNSTSGAAIGDDAEPTPLEEEDDDEARYTATGVSYNEINDLTSALQMFNLLQGGLEGQFGGQQLGSLIPISTPDIIALIPQRQAKFASASIKLENEEKIYNLHKVIDGFGEIPIHSPCLDNAAQNLIDNSTLKENIINYRLAIVGPRHSGKSVFLKILAKKTAIRLISSGQSRRTFVCSLDFEHISNTPLELYYSFIDHLFVQLSDQKLNLLPHVAPLTAYFKKLPTISKVPAMPNTFTQDDDFRNAVPLLDNLAHSIFDITHEYNSLDLFLTKLVTLPNFFARCFGFSVVLFFIDHFDMSDIDINEVPELSAETGVSPFIEYVKLMIASEPYVISCHDEIHLLESLQLTFTNGIDLIDSMEIFSVCDLDIEHSAQSEFLLTIQGEPEKVKFSIEDCGGCSGYLVKWDELIEAATKLRSEEIKNKKSRLAIEMKLQILAHLRDLAPHVLQGIDAKTGEVTPLGHIEDFQLVQIETKDE